MQYKTVSVIGLGYIGLPTAALFASAGSNVIGVDVSSDIVATINRGDIHIIEPGLKDIVKEAVKHKNLRAVVEPEHADAYIIAVPTPFKKGSGVTPLPDMQFVNEACDAIAPKLRRGNLVVLESTCPIGTTEVLTARLATLRPDLTFPNNDNDEYVDVNISYCPERVLPGNILEELVSNDRIIGGITKNCSLAAEKLYSKVIKGNCLLTNAKTAELSKLAENASRDAQIAFANELSIVCDEHSVNVWELIDLCNRHPRVNILQPGPGVGGHCIAVDPWFIISSVSKNNADYMRSARLTNLRKEDWVIEKVTNYLSLHDCRRVVIFGLAFKENIDDFRESPSLRIATQLKALLNENLLAVEPNCRERTLGGILLIDESEVDYNSDLCVFLLAHNEFYNTPMPKHAIDVKGIFRKIKD